MTDKTASQSNRVLLVSIGFPPEGGGGSMRVTKMAKYLPCFGWATVVLTARAPRQPAVVAPSMDTTVAVYRAPRLEVLRWMYRAKLWLSRLVHPNRGRETAAAASANGAPANLPRHLSEYLLVPDERIFWVPLAILLGLYAVWKQKPQAIYSTSPTATAHLAGYGLHRLTGLPWVVEFRDPWMLNPFRLPRPYGWLERLEGRVEHAVVLNATHVVVTSPQYKRDFCAAYPELSPERVSYVPNGFDPEDFLGVTPFQFDRFTIVHTGSFYAQRSARTFLNAVHDWLQAKPAIRSSVQVVFVGNLDPDSTQEISNLRLQDVVRQVGSVVHREAIRYMLAADLLLLVPGPGDGTMPGKAFEYLAAARPILALADEGAVHELITSARLGEVASPADVGSITEALARMHARITSGGFVYPQTAELRQRFDRRAIAGRMAALLDSLTAQRQHCYCASSQSSPEVG